MGKRYEAIGIKQAIRFEWMQKTVNLLLVGIDAKTIRQELHEFLSDRKGNGCEGKGTPPILIAMTISMAWSREDKNMIGTVEILRIS